MAFKKFVKATFRNYKKKAKKRYIRKGGAIKVGKIAKDVMTLKKMINAEKKHITTDIENATVGQVNINASGHYIIDVSPAPIQGTGVNNRTGQSIKHHSSYYVFQFKRQVGQAILSALRIKIQFVYVVGQPYGTITNALGPFLKPNPFIDGTSVYDLQSERRPEYFTDFKVLRTKYVYFQQNDQSSQAIIKTVKVGLKMPNNFHVKWQGNTTTQTIGQVFMLITAEHGNCGGTNSTLDDITISQLYTGVDFDWYSTHYYYDN